MLEIILKENSSPDYETILCLTGDHTTPVIYGDHTFEPVPVTISSLTALKLEMGSL